MNYRQKGGDDVCCETVEGAAFEGVVVIPAIMYQSVLL